MPRSDKPTFQRPRQLVQQIMTALLLLGPLFSLTSVAAFDNLPTDWRTGIATNYGGAQDGDSPYSPSYGTSIGSCG